MKKKNLPFKLLTQFKFELLANEFLDKDRLTRKKYYIRTNKLDLIIVLKIGSGWSV